MSIEPLPDANAISAPPPAVTTTQEDVVPAFVTPARPRAQSQVDRADVINVLAEDRERIRDYDFLAPVAVLVATWHDLQTAYDKAVAGTAALGDMFYVGVALGLVVWVGLLCYRRHKHPPMSLEQLADKICSPHD